jgi:hypothetical protein
MKSDQVRTRVASSIMDSIFGRKSSYECLLAVADERYRTLFKHETGASLAPVSCSIVDPVYVSEASQTRPSTPFTLCGTFRKCKTIGDPT